MVITTRSRHDAFGLLFIALLSFMGCDAVATLRQATEAEIEELGGTFLYEDGSGKLNLNETPVTDDGLENLEYLPHLNIVWLRDTQIGDAGLAHLVDLPELKWLDAGNTNITDAGLEHLVKMDALQGVNLVGTNVTKEGEAKLRQAMPNCRVDVFRN